MKKWIITLIFLGFLSICFDVIAQDSINPPLISFTTINRYAQSTTDLDEVDDTRNFTSEALFSQSRIRLNRTLTKEELARIIRTKDQFETFNNLRFRPKPPLAIDLSYKYREIDDAQIMNFFEPNRFNDMNVSEYGIAVQASSDINQYGFLVRGAYKRVNREGIIEFLPDSDEDIDQYEVNALVSRSFGEERAAFYATYMFQDIQLNIPNPYNRDRDIFAFLLTYGKQDIAVGLEKETRPVSAIENIFERKFDTRGLKFFSGVVFDIETFGDVDVKKNDYFIGSSLCAWMDAKNCPITPFDISIELNIFTSEVEEDSSQDNAQYRTNITTYYQIGRSLTLLVPLRHDIAIDGPDDFENWKAGVELRHLLTSERGLSARCYASLRYDHQRFFNVNRELDLFGVNVSLTF